MVKRIAVLCCAVLLGARPSDGQERIVPDALTLAHALTLAIERNPRLGAARAGVSMAEADRVTASRRPTPALTFDSIGDYPFKTGQAIDQHEYLVRVDQEIETAGRRQLRQTAAEQGIGTAQASYADERRRLELDVKRAYLQAVLAKTDREVAQSTLVEIDNLIKLSRARFEQGEISGTEPRRLQVERLRFVDDVFAADLALRNARSTLLTLLHAPDLAQEFDPIDPLLVATPTTPSPPILAAALADIPALRTRATSSRPEIAAARSEEARTETETRLQRALRSPNLTVGGGYSHLGGLNVVAFGVTVPLSFLSRNTGAISRAEAEHLQATQRTAAVLDEVALDVQRAVNAAQVNRARVEYMAREHVSIAREARDIVLASYRLGETDLIDYLDAQRAFRDTQRTYNRALYEERLSLFELEAAVGTTSAVSLQGK